MSKPEIVMEDWKGRHNVSDYQDRLKKSGTYKDLSTICVVPTRGMIHFKVVQNWMGMITPMNQKFMRMFVSGMEVGAAYSQAIDMILAHPDLSKWKYVLTLEEDNLVPPDGLIRLTQSMDEYDAVGGLYWTKGEGGQPMCYGHPKQFPINFIPQIPAVDALTECNGLGMGFTLFKISMLKKMKEQLKGDLFKTLNDFVPGEGIKVFTQDLYFFLKAREMGYKFACDARVKVGHYDKENDIVW
jgi:hypothetical protein